jgi:hypothetical protein
VWRRAFCAGAGMHGRRGMHARWDKGCQSWRLGCTSRFHTYATHLQ